MNKIVYLGLVMLLLSGCGGYLPFTGSDLPLLETKEVQASPEVDYLIGPGDSVQIFVWRNPEVTTTITVRPDGKISTPLVEDMQASGKTPTQLARDIEEKLGVYIRNPVVTIMVGNFVGPISQQVRVVGEATTPQRLFYQEDMSVLDVMIAVGGLTEFADGDNATVVRIIDGEQKQFRVRLDALLKEGDITANVKMLPGDVLIIPEAWF